METANLNQKGKAARDLLQKAFEDRVNSNSAYSLRAFARDLSMDPSQLSEVLKGRKGISLQKAQGIAQVLALSDAEAAIFKLAVERDHGRSARSRHSAVETIAKLGSNAFQFQNLSMDHYSTISEWHHSAILEYLRRPRVDQSVKSIASSFQISELQVSESLKKLERLEMIRRRGSRYHVNKQAYASPDGVPSEALKKHHVQILKKAQEAVHFQSVEDRGFSSTQLLIKKSQLPEIKSFMRETLSEFCSRFAQNGSGDSVYEFAYQLFELGKLETKTKEKV